MEQSFEEEEEEKIGKQQQMLSSRVTIAAPAPDRIIFNRYKQSLMESLQGSTRQELEKIKLNLDEKESLDVFPPFGNSIMYNYALFFFPGLVPEKNQARSNKLSNRVLHCEFSPQRQKKDCLNVYRLKDFPVCIANYALAVYKQQVFVIGGRTCANDKDEYKIEKRVWVADVLRDTIDEEPYAELKTLSPLLTEEKELASAMQIEEYLFVFGGLVSTPYENKRKKRWELKQRQSNVIEFFDGERFQRLDISGHAPELPLYCAIRFTSLSDVQLIGGMNKDLVGLFSTVHVNLLEQTVDEAVESFPTKHGLWFHTGNFYVDNEDNFITFGVDNMERYFVFRLDDKGDIHMELASSS